MIRAKPFRRLITRPIQAAPIFGLTNKSFIDGVKTASEQLHAENTSSAVPIDLVTASGSGLDPHITPAAAQFQVARVAKARNLPEIDVAKLVGDNTKQRLLGLFGEPLALNNVEA